MAAKFYLFIYLFIYLFVYLFIYLFIYVFLRRRQSKWQDRARPISMQLSWSKKDLLYG